MSAPSLVEQMMAVLHQRGGFDSWWDTIDEDIQEEIIDELLDVAGNWVS